MGFLLNLVAAALFAFASVFLRSDPEPPEDPGDIDSVPFAKQGKEIAKIYGTVWITKFNLAWRGDQRRRPVYQTTGKKG